MATGFKTGGRQKGTPNKTTVEIREALKIILSKELDSLPEILSSMKPVDRINAIVRLMPYIMPRPTTNYDVSLFEDAFPSININPIQWV